MTEYQNAEDERVFKEILSRDPESRKCFECNYPNAPWCDINHGIFVCLDCSGVHRGLGVHLSFVRSSTMDGWSNWRPEKLQQMRVGGNSKAQAFFDKKGVPKAPIRERYSHLGALMYKDKLEAEAAGKPFNEAAWQPPDWAAPGRQQQQQTRNTGGDRFQGQGSAGTARPAQQSSGDDWMSTLTSGLSNVASATTKMASTAATATVQGTQHLVTKVQESSRSAPSTDDLGKKAQETAAAAGTAMSNVWGAFSSWTSAAVSQLTSDGGAKRGAEDDDGLGGLTRNLRRDGESEDPRFRGVAHQASPMPGNDGLSSLAHNLPRGGATYDGIGGSNASSPAAPAARQSPPLSRQATAASSPSPAMGSRQASSASMPASTPKLAQSPPPAPQSKPTSSAASPTAQKNANAAVPSEWGWDEE